MKSIQFTPGPWTVNNLGYIGTKSNGSGWTLVALPVDSQDADGTYVKIPPKIERKANSKLISTAPDLLNALLDCITEEGAPGLQEGLGRMRRRLLAINKIARDAIAKATQVD